MKRCVHHASNVYTHANHPSKKSVNDQVVHGKRYHVVCCSIQLQIALNVQAQLNVVDALIVMMFTKFMSKKKKKNPHIHKQTHKHTHLLTHSNTIIIIIITIWLCTSYVTRHRQHKCSNLLLTAYVTEIQINPQKNEDEIDERKEPKKTK